MQQSTDVNLSWPGFHAQVSLPHSPGMEQGVLSTWALSLPSLSTVPGLPSQLMQSQCAPGASGTWHVGRQTIKILSTPCSIWLDKQLLMKLNDVRHGPEGRCGTHTPISQISQASRGLRSRTIQNKERKGRKTQHFVPLSCKCLLTRMTSKIMLYGERANYLKG